MYLGLLFQRVNRKVQNNIQFHQDFHSKVFTKTVGCLPSSCYIKDLSLINALFSYYWARDKKSKSDFSTSELVYLSWNWSKAELIFSGNNDWIFEMK